jgi:hypothetical protein
MNQKEYLCRAVNYTWRPKNGEEFPPHVQRKIDACPFESGGLHNHLSTVANALCHWVSVDRGEQIIRELAISRGRDERTAASEARELRKKWVGKTQCTPGVTQVYTPMPPAPPKPTRDDALINRIVTQGSVTAACDLRGASAIHFEDDDDTVTLCVLGQLFEPRDLVFVSRTPKTGNPVRLCNIGIEYDRDLLSRMSFIVPNPLRYNQVPIDGYLERCNANIKQVRWYVLEWDIAKYSRNGKTLTAWAPLIDEWQRAGITIRDANARLIDHIARFVKPAIIVDTAGKSLHSWLPSLTMSDETAKDLSAYAQVLGADNCLSTISQLFRMPGGTRENGKHQSVLYFNPSIINLNKQHYSK